jgi:hypothetical protein
MISGPPIGAQFMSAAMEIQADCSHVSVISILPSKDVGLSGFNDFKPDVSVGAVRRPRLVQE